MMSRGMTQIGSISLQNWTRIFSSLLNPWVAAGTLLLIGFLATYMAALSWADLTFVLPATSVSYVLIALLGQFLLGEHITTLRWLGIALVTGGVGFVARDRPHTPQVERIEQAERR